MTANGLAISVMLATALTENDRMPFSIIPSEGIAPHHRVVLAYHHNSARSKALTALCAATLQSQPTGVAFANEWTAKQKAV